MNSLQNFLLLLALVLVAGALGYAILIAHFYLVKLLKTKLGEQRYTLFASQVERVVRYLEQVGERYGYDGPRKLEIAKVLLRQICDHFDLPITDEQIEQAIEAFVHVINGEKFPVTFETTEPVVGG